MFTSKSVASFIDHTILRADATRAEVSRVCAEAREHLFASVCVNSCWIPFVANQLQGTEVKVCAVAGFPLGAMATRAKAAEAEMAVLDGAQEIDMVLNVGWLKEGEYPTVQDDVAAVAAKCHEGGAILKVILETCLLTDDEKRKACELSVAAGADFVKTSTGFGSAGATEADVRLMRAVVGPNFGVKASGGIRTFADFQRMVEAGASRVGASASVKIVVAAAGT